MMIKYNELEQILDGLCKRGAQVLEIGSNGKPGYLDDRNDLRIIRSNVKRLPGVNSVFNAEAIPFDDSRFDLVFLIATDYYVKDMNKMFQEISRVLKVGGIVVNATYSESNLRWQVKNQEKAIHAKSWKAYEKMYNAIGFESVLRLILNNPPQSNLKRFIWSMIPRKLLLLRTQWRVHICVKSNAKINM